MLDRGEIQDYVDIARLGYITRARASQIMNLTLLAPDIQEEILNLTPTGKLPIERNVRHVASLVIWADQRRAWTDTDTAFKSGDRPA